MGQGPGWDALDEKARQLAATPEWLNSAVLYEIYPQSFRDSNGDGIGDLQGIIESLDYLEWLGVDAIWLNPCFASPFRDAGYDVSDYFSIAPRYGTNEDLVRLVDEAAARNVRVLLDLVVGHTSVEHPWFIHAAEDAHDDRYIWADRPGESFVKSPGTRAGWYLKNFFDEQPALNFGYASTSPDEPWRELPDASGPRRNVEDLKRIIAFWLDMGVSGFRVDMAYSLVKDDPGLVATAALWREVHQWMRSRYPEAILLPEGSDTAPINIGEKAGFDADFALVIHPEHSALFNNGHAGLLPWQHEVRPCYFDAECDPADGVAALNRFLTLWDERTRNTSAWRSTILATADHDYSRLAIGSRQGAQLRPALTFLLTWGTIPSIYYGDECGMRYQENLPDTEGSVWTPSFNRAGCRTPMQWQSDAPNAGFSDAEEADLYLPLDPDPHRPTVAAQVGDPHSLLNLVRTLIQLRRRTPDLGTGAARTIEHAGYPLVYGRGGSHLVVVNPREDAHKVFLPSVEGASFELLLGEGVSIEEGTVSAQGCGYAVFRRVEDDVTGSSRPRATPACCGEYE